MADLVTVTQAKTYMGVKESSYDALIGQLVTSMSEWFERETGRYFGPAKDIVEIVTGHGSPNVQVSTNILTLTKLEMRWTLQSWMNIDLSLVEVDGNVIRRVDLFNFLDAYQGVRVTYSGGYAAVPADVQQAVLEMVAKAFRQRIQVSSALPPSGDTDTLPPWSGTVRDTIKHYRGIPAAF